MLKAVKSGLLCVWAQTIQSLVKVWLKLSSQYKSFMYLTEQGKVITSHCVSEASAQFAFIKTCKYFEKLNHRVRPHFAVCEGSDALFKQLDSSGGNDTPHLSHVQPQHRWVCWSRSKCFRWQMICPVRTVWSGNIFLPRRQLRRAQRSQIRS